MTLFGKASGERNLYQGFIRGGEFLTCKFDPQLANVFSYRAIVGSPESAGQRNWMHVGELGHLGKSDRLTEAFLQQIFYLFEPVTVPILSERVVVTGHPRHQFQSQPFYRQRRQIILRTEFAIKSRCESRQWTVLKLGKIPLLSQMSIRSLDPSPGQLDGEETYSRTTHPVGVDRAARHERQTTGFSNQDLFAPVFLDHAL